MIIPNQIKNPNEMSGFKVFGWVQPHLLIEKKRKGNRQREPLRI